MWQVLRTTRSASSPSAAARHALCAEQLGHALAVIDVHLAAEAFDAVSLGKIRHFAAPIGEPAPCKEEQAPRRLRRAPAWPSPCGRRSGGSGPSRRMVTGKCPVRPSTRRTLAMPGFAAVPADDRRQRPIIDRDRPDHARRRAAGPRLEAGSSGTAADGRHRRSCLPGRGPAAGGAAGASAIAATWPWHRAAVGAVDVEGAVLVGEPAEEAAGHAPRPWRRRRSRSSRRGSGCRASWYDWRAARCRASAGLPSQRRSTPLIQATPSRKRRGHARPAEQHLAIRCERRDRRGTDRSRPATRQAARKRRGMCAQRPRSRATP